MCYNYCKTIKILCKKNVKINISIYFSIQNSTVGYVYNIYALSYLSKRFTECNINDKLVICKLLQFFRELDYY